MIGISLYPGKLLDERRLMLAPAVKMLALAILGVAAVMWPTGLMPLWQRRIIKNSVLQAGLLMVII